MAKKKGKGGRRRASAPQGKSAGRRPKHTRKKQTARSTPARAPRPSGRRKTWTGATERQVGGSGAGTRAVRIRRGIYAAIGIAAIVAMIAFAVIDAGDGGGEGERVERVVDGDTLELGDGRRVRLVQIDAPEAGEGECFSAEATEELARLVPRGSSVVLRRDPRLDDRDRFGRLLRYVFAGGRNVNLELVRAGAASPWFVGGDRGRYARRLVTGARRARRAGAGLWGACPRTRLDLSAGVQTGR